MMLRGGVGAAGDADGAGGASGGSGDAVGDGSVGDAPGVCAAGDADGEGAAGGAAGAGAAGDTDGEGVAVDALVDGAAGDVVTVRGLRMLDVVRAWVVVGDSGRGPSPLLAEGPVGVADRWARRSWRCWSLLVSRQLLATPGRGCRWCC